MKQEYTLKSTVPSRFFHTQCFSSAAAAAAAPHTARNICTKLPTGQCRLRAGRQIASRQPRLCRQSRISPASVSVGPAKASQAFEACNDSSSGDDLTSFLQRESSQISRAAHAFYEGVSAAAPPTTLLLLDSAELNQQQLSKKFDLRSQDSVPANAARGIRKISQEGNSGEFFSTFCITCFDKK